MTIGYNYFNRVTGDESPECVHVAGKQKTIVDTLRYSGIVLQCFLLLFCVHNIYKYLIKSVEKKPLSLIIFYSFSTLTLVSLIFSLAVATELGRNQLIIEWTSITVAEMGI